MLDKIDNILQNQCKIHPDDLLLVGTSGGPDSLCLLHVLHQIGYPIMSMHVNHKLRPEAGKEVMVVEQFARDLEIDFISREADVLSYAQEFSVSIEEAARTLRYQLLFEQAQTHNANAVVVAHNADDQVETILMHFLRGSGMSGLRGMEYRTIPNPWSENIALIRPFLSTWRADIQKYLDDHDLHPVTDESNLDVSFFRNRIRHELLPILENYNPSVSDAFLRVGMNVKDDFELLQQLTDKAWESIFIKRGNGYVALDSVGFISQPISIQRYLLRKAISIHIPGLRDVDFECIERGISLLRGTKSRSQTNLIAGIRLIKEGKQFYIATWMADLPTGDFPAIPPGENYVLQIPSTLELNDGWQLEVMEIQLVKLIDILGEAGNDPYQAWLEANALELPLTLRARKPGDKMAPVGLGGHSIKISDVMINLKLPLRARATWPLVCSGEAIVWMPGYRFSYHARICPGSNKAIHLKLSHLHTT